jgi:hypothetical protein
MTTETWPGQNWSPDRAEIHELLSGAEIEACELLPTGSNYVFVVRLNAGAAGEGLGIYKPLRGEQPLWDYPEGNLYQREVAAYLTCRALGWNFVPPTVIRDGPHGVGSVQLFIEHDQRQTYFSMRELRAGDLRRMAVFDCVVNNGDRKGGHCLLGRDGRIWGIDHGLTFHTEQKLRTVIWDYAGEEMPQDLLGDLHRLGAEMGRPGGLIGDLQPLLTKGEIIAFRRRLQEVLRERRFPTAGYRRSVPWPPV